MKPLTEEEIATLATIRVGDPVGADTINLFGRLLDEVGRHRAKDFWHNPPSQSPEELAGLDELAAHAGYDRVSLARCPICKEPCPAFGPGGVSFTLWREPFHGMPDGPLRLGVRHANGKVCGVMPPRER